MLTKRLNSNKIELFTPGIPIFFIVELRFVKGNKTILFLPGVKMKNVPMEFQAFFGKATLAIYQC